MTYLPYHELAVPFLIIFMHQIKQFQYQNKQQCIAMNSKRLTDFSNIYSPANKSFLSTLPKTLNTSQIISPSLTLTSRFSPTPSPRSISPGIYNIPKLGGGKNENRLRLGKEQINKINYTLEVEGTSKRKYKQRLRQQDLYIDYNYNPFSQQCSKKNKRKDRKEVQEKQKKQEKRKELNLVEAVIKSKNKPKEEFAEEIKRKLVKIEQNARRILTIIQNDKNSKKQLQYKKAKQKYITQDKQYQERFLKIQKSGLDELLEITSIKEQSYFKTKREQQPFNIFELIHNPESKMFMSGRQQLGEYYFSFDSMSSSSQTSVNQHFLRDLSTYSRIAIFNSSSRAIPEYHKMTDINGFFEDETNAINSNLYLAKGLIQPQSLAKFISGEMDFVRKNQSSEFKESEADEKVLFYKQNQRSKQSNWGGQTLSKAELTYYKDEKLTRQQNKQIELSKTYSNMIKAVIKKQANCYVSSINDKNLLQSFESQKTAILCRQMDANIRMLPGKEEVQRKIRMSKLNKNKAEKLKTIAITETHKEIRSAQKVFKKIKGR